MAPIRASVTTSIALLVVRVGSCQYPQIRRTGQQNPGRIVAPDRYPPLNHVLLRPPRPPSRLASRRVLRPIPRRILERVAEHPLRTTHLALARCLRTRWRGDHPAATRPLQLTLRRRRRRRLLHGSCSSRRRLALRVRFPLCGHVRLPCKCSTFQTPCHSVPITQGHRPAAIVRKSTTIPPNPRARFRADWDRWSPAEETAAKTNR